jgi:nicotinate-nucleotide pyrophosphorylase (carboxylating)
VLVEVSGGVTVDTVGAFAAAGADLVSVGAITHSAQALDIGLDLGATAGPGGRPDGGEA